MFVGDPGPGFDPAGAPEPELAPPAGLEPVAEWEEGTVRSILTAKGTVLHMAVGVGEEEWLYLQHELDAIAPPLTRILNRYPVTRAAAEGGDAIAVMIGLGGYVSRSYIERRAALADAEQAEPEPVTGVSAPPGTGPEHDPAQQAALGEQPGWSTESRP